MKSLLDPSRRSAGRVARRSAAALLAVALPLGAVSVPAHAAPPVGDDAIISAQLQALVSPALAVAQNMLVRNLVRDAALEQFDGDTNVLLTDVVRRSEEEGIVDPNDDGWVQFKNGVSNFAPVGGHPYKPQIYIPNLDGTAVPGDSIIMAVQPADGAATSLPGYELNYDGQVSTVSFPIDEAYVDTHEVWVLTVNEESDPPTEDGTTLAKSIPGNTSIPGKKSAGASSRGSTNVTCNPSGRRLNRGVEYLTAFKVPSPNDLERWWQGKLEMWLEVTTAGGDLVSRVKFPKRTHKSIKNWNYMETRLTTWDRAVWGEMLVYRWYERGPNIADAGTQTVPFSDSTFTEYTTSSVVFTVCSVGGDGNDGNENYARTATVGVSSTFNRDGYSKDRVNDGSRSTDLGGPHSWSNAAGTWPGNQTEWVALDFGFNRTFQRVVVYTTASLPIRDYDIQVLSSTFGWRSIASVRDNTQPVVTSTFPMQTQRQVRILALKGPNDQPGFVRINEFEVYPTL